MRKFADNQTENKQVAGAGALMNKTPNMQLLYLELI